MKRSVVLLLLMVPLIVLCASRFANTTQGSNSGPHLLRQVGSIAVPAVWPIPSARFWRRVGNK